MLQTPRARSKSRHIMDKINGLFSGRREKKPSPAPPIPVIAENSSSDRNVEVAGNGSPVRKASKGPPGSKMPTISPAHHPAFRSTSRNTSLTSVETPVDSVTAGDDSQVLQSWSASLHNKAQRQPNAARKERMLTFAKVSRCSADWDALSVLTSAKGVE